MSEPTSKTALWEAVFKTDPTRVKPITGKQYTGTSPQPYYLYQKATETFGPCGIGWGFTVLDERIEEGSEGEKVSFAHVRVWYVWKGHRGEVEHVGGTVFSGKRSSGKGFADEDAPKKSVTDAVVKALSLIGFAGDIFSGRYDDSKYVAELKAEKAEETKQSANVNYAETALEITSALNECKTLDELQDTFSRHWKQIKTLPDNIQAAVTRTKDERKAELSKPRAVA